MQNIFRDGKTFPDCFPKKPLAEIKDQYEKEKNQSGFDLKTFISDYFEIPENSEADYKSNTDLTIYQHIDSLWDVLSRNPASGKGSLIPLPYPYIVPGGRFREIYYWDSYFTMLGLKASGKFEMIENMVRNFAHLIETFGYIPNGNRTYFLGRSQPPFFSLMVKLLSEHNERALIDYLPHLEKEYQFWMRGAENLSATTRSFQRVVRMRDGEILNRYWDENDTPRPESYKEDVELSHDSARNAKDLFRHIRAAAESGWDFSSRWFKTEDQFSSIHTTDIVPVDLNCILLHLEQTLAEGYLIEGDSRMAEKFSSLSSARKKAILTYFWDENQHFFFDFDFVQGFLKPCYTLAGAFPLFFKVATPYQAFEVQKILEKRFLKAGGLTTTLIKSGQQWDAPNGWAPLQWIAYKGLLNYHFGELAAKLKTRWMNANRKVFSKTFKLTEKYDVWNKDSEASGGEYPNQDGFGWTNGVFLAMSKT